MANEREVSIQKEMAKLRNEFHDRLIVELEEFVAYASLTDQEICRTETLQKLYEASHRLAGSSLTFGYSDTGALLRRLEAALDAILNHGHEIDVASLRRKLDVLAPAVSIPVELRTDTDPAKSDTESSHTTPTVAEKLHIYVLENDSETSEMLKTGLSSFGYKISTYTSIEALCDATSSKKPDG